MKSDLYKQWMCQGFRILAACERRYLREAKRPLRGIRL